MADQFLIYGGSGGIGLAIARRLRSAGHDLHLVARDAGRLSDVADHLGATCTVGDGSLPETQARVSASIGDRPLAGLVYAVGSITLKPFSRLTEADYLEDYRINALGAVGAIRAALPALQRREQGAAILLFSTVAVTQGFASHASIAMAKGAVEGLTLSLAAELAPRIRVNAIAPSLTETALAAAVTANAAMTKAIAGLHALGRIGRPEDMAGLAEVLITDAGSWITGQVIGVDGGRGRLRTKG